MIIKVAIHCKAIMNKQLQVNEHIGLVGFGDKITKDRKEKLRICENRT
jgi:hypothetical protein